MGRRHPDRIVRPGLGQIQRPVDEGMAMARDVGREDADLAVGDLACRTRVLASHTARRLALLQEPGLIQDKDSIRIGQRLQKKTVDLLGKSAEQGFVPAQQHLGELYLQGDKTLQDFGQAEVSLHKAAVAGNASAQRELGRIYALGLGVPRDPSMAYR